MQTPLPSETLNSAAAYFLRPVLFLEMYKFWVEPIDKDVYEESDAYADVFESTTKS